MKLILLTAAGLAACLAAPVAARDSDPQIKSRIIQESIASYPGNCPCPYHSARNGSRCGGLSAYNRGGGYAPLCFPGDVGRTDVDAYRRRTGR